MTVDFVATAGSGAPSAPSQTAQGSARTVNATVNAGAIWCSTAAGSTTNTHSWTTATNGSYQGGFDLIAAATASTKLSITRFRANAFTHGRK
ncbi:MAG TPA: hypothetical protein VM577_13580 [Anaerovoracaceae bacterium]|nr:hypothetical protein [Anaerovoracaceae bacterium]